MPYLNVNGADLYYALSGAGRPAFVFIHGGCCRHEDWRKQVDTLRHDTTVLTLDLRGHGRSTNASDDCGIARWAADVNAMIDALKLAPAVLTGHSLGSRVVAEAAWQRPDNAAAVILLDGSRMYGGFASAAPPTPQPTAPPSAAVLADILDATVGPYADAATRAYVVESMSAAPPDLFTTTREALRDWDIHRADQVFTELPPGLPMLAIQSTYHDLAVVRTSLKRDTETTPYLDFVRSARPDVVVHILPEVGHFSMLEKSDEVTSLIKAFGVAAFQTHAEKKR